MCGIAGVAAWPGLDANAARRVVARMVAAMVHRGPDEQAAAGFPEAEAALGAARLALVDAANGSQPVASGDGQVWAVLNGEIYNYGELREDMLARGRRFRTASDTEVLVHLYEVRGEQMFAELNGMYAAALVDLRRRQVLLARDHAGMKPLFYTERGGGLAFASDVRALLAGGLVEPAADWKELGRYLELGYIPAPGSAFEGVRKLLPGCYLRWEPGRSEVRRHWTPPEECGPHDPEAPARLEDLLREAVRSHLQGDVEVGCWLSGGWDSSIVAAMAAERVGRLRTFSLVFPESPGADEAGHARAVAAALGSRHEEVAFRPAMLPELVENCVWTLEEPSACTPNVLAGLLARLAARNVKAVVGGEGADELFAGYDWLGPRLPYWLRAAMPAWAARLLLPLAPDFRWRRGLRQVAAASADDVDYEFVRRGHPAEFPPPQGLARRDFTGADAYAAAGCQLGVDPARFQAGGRLRKRLLLEFGGRLTGGILYANDRMSMAESLELRMPFLDRRIVEFAMRTPVEWKRRGRQEKVILKPLAEKYAPAVAKRRKQGLHVPEQNLRTVAMREFSERVLLEEGSLFPRAEMERVLRRWFERAPGELRYLQLLLRLQLWWNTFVRAGSRGARLAADALPGAERVTWKN